MKTDSDKLDLIKPAIAIFVMILLIGGGVFALNNLNKQRKNAVYQQYKQETDGYIARNQTALNEFFSKVSSNPTCGEYPSSSPCVPKDPIKDIIDHKLNHDLKDWSSTVFFAPGSSDGQVNVVRLGGDVYPTSTYGPDKKNQVIKLLKGEVSELPWDDYTYDLAGKEVVIPVKNGSGQVIGAIVRSVIEEKSF